jgi:hypothetical protein
MKNLGKGGQIKGSLNSGMSFSGGHSLSFFGFCFGEPFLPVFGSNSSKVNIKNKHEQVQNFGNTNQNGSRTAGKGRRGGLV